jgi:hypothetical protein
MELTGDRSQRRLISFMKCAGALTFLDLFSKSKLPVGARIGLDLILRSHRRPRQATITGRGNANSGSCSRRRRFGAQHNIGVRDHADLRGPRRSDRSLSGSVRIGALIGRTCRRRRKLLVRLHAGARRRSARAHLRHAAGALRLSRGLDAGPRWKTSDKPTGHASSLEHLSGFGSAVDHPARRSLPQDALHAGSGPQRHRGKLRSRRSRAGAVSAPAHAESGALRIRKRRQRPPLAPSRYTRRCRSRHKARLKCPLPRPLPGPRQSQDNLARSPPDPLAHAAQETSALPDESRRTRMHAVFAAKAGREPEDRAPCPASAACRPRRRSSASRWV